jgi:tetratricopeptide (TPR) repeat protein
LDIARYPQAKQLLDRAMNALPAESAGPDWKQAIGLANLGRWWHEQGYHAEAEPIYRRAVEAFQKLGSSGAGVTVRFEFAKLLAKQGKPAEAEAILHATLEEENRTGTKDSLTLALCLDHLAMVRLLQGNVRDAEGLERRALAMLEKIAGPNTPALSPGMALLGGILKVQGKWHEAEESYREALLLREEYCAPEHPALAEVLEEYAELLEVMGRGEEAQMHHHRAHQIRDFHAASRLVG